MLNNTVFMLEDMRGSQSMFPVKDLEAGIVLAHILCGEHNRDLDNILWVASRQSTVIGYINGNDNPDFIINCMPVFSVNEYSTKYMEDVMYFARGARVFEDLPGEQWWTHLQPYAEFPVTLKEIVIPDPRTENGEQVAYTRMQVNDSVNFTQVYDNLVEEHTHDDNTDDDDGPYEYDDPEPGDPDDDGFTDEPPF